MMAPSTVMAICLIAAITGNLDVPGRPAPAPRARAAPRACPDWQNWRRPTSRTDWWPRRAPVWYQKTAGPENGPTSAYYKGLMSILTGKPYPLRVLGAGCTNPLSATRNPQKVAEALKKLDFMFVMDVCRARTSTSPISCCPPAPATSRASTSAPRGPRRASGCAAYNQVVEPLGESRSDWQLLP